MKQSLKQLFLLVFTILLILGLCACGEPAIGNEKDTVPPSDGQASGEVPDDTGDGAEGNTGDNPDGKTDEEEPADPHLHQVTALGLTPNDPSAASANTLALNTQIYNAEESTTILFEAGTYYFATVSFFPSQEGCITMSGKKDLTLRGKTGETTFVNTSYSPKERCNPAAYMASSILLIDRCVGIAIEGIAFDYLAPTNLSATVVSVSPSGNYTVLRPLDAGDGVTGGEYVFCVNIFDAAGVPKTEVWMPGDSPYALTALGNGTFRIQGVYGTAGDLVCARFTSGTYACPLLFVQGTDGLTLRSCQVYSCPSATVYAVGGNANFTFDRFSIGNRQGEYNLFCSNEDGIHLKGLRGTLTIRDCSFEGMGDDVLNLHSKAAVVSSLMENLLTLQDGITGGSLDGSWAYVGDTVDFYTTQLVKLGSATVTAISGSQVLFDAIPTGVTTGTVLQNVSNTPTSVIITGTSVVRSRARAFLLQCPTATVTGCRIQDTALAGILIAPDIGDWYEMGPSRNITIEDCAFVHCGNSGNAAITVRADHDDTSLATVSAPIHGTVTVQGCSFTDCVTAVYARRVETLTVASDCTYSGCTRTVDR